LTQVVRLLLITNVIAFLLQNTVAPWITRAFSFYPPLAIVQPWTLVTYMFLHGSFTHILFNMLVLYFFGPRVEGRIGSRRFAILYFVSGIVGALFQFIFAPGAPMIGASAGVFGVQLAFAMFWPDTIIHIWGIIPMSMRMMVMATTVLAIASPYLGLGRGIAHFAHLGGYAGAWLYLKWIDRKRGEFRRKAVAPTPEAAVRVEKWKAIDPARVHAVNRDEVNRILDKINATGLGSLTPEERLFLSNFVPMDDGPVKA
jgi:membrane associated rhomboid family serine protease